MLEEMRGGGHCSQSVAIKAYILWRRLQIVRYMYNCTCSPGAISSVYTWTWVWERYEKCQQLLALLCHFLVSLNFIINAMKDFRLAFVRQINEIRTETLQNQNFKDFSMIRYIHFLNRTKSTVQDITRPEQ
jgi:hypothetical protein